jgi:hypothetical protein
MVTTTTARFDAAAIVLLTVALESVRPHEPADAKVREQA